MATKHTTRPIVTGTSVVGLQYKDGILLAADTMLSYGSMVKSFQTPRMKAIQGQILLAASGEYSDFQEICQQVDALCLEETTESMTSIYDDDSRTIPARNVWNYLRAVLYRKRSQMNPFWNTVVVAGLQPPSGADSDGKAKPFLGTVDKLGTTLQEPLVATGFGAYLALPLMREHWRPDLEEGEARALLEDCMKVLFFRDCRASARIQLAKVTEDGGVTISEPYELDHSNAWSAPSLQRAVGDLSGDGGW
eukprot:CAMPEP_0119551036 /NCGR_PEP_ID=MMETSP1352-20130426/4424_1 /TAXON_ID=265584 /ORGANISM="Stauroneis constricta, Strain CCMP1120" /LENGTH=249 /DNA_ID=CAMNT_0007597043 /DNA_START=154 /DNA_END=903 /DNA_ORIENTATION=-